MNKSCLILWDKLYFEQKDRTPPNAELLYTQLYLGELGSWSIALRIDTHTITDPFEVIADEVYFPIGEAPHNVLQDGYTFDFMEGRVVIGKCIIIDK
ncbi:hypothetical protein [Myroides sp. N17-2]|uniref:hypothetical protein n=1 Tax=Myroides sp. N17-2 TaxID=2030799 RepID=UPI000EFC9616|nr:hypothetical protein [Myroides sp. N17-2]